MAPRYQVGQKVIIKPMNEGPPSTRDSALQPYLGQIGKIADHHWISRDRDSEVFYIYTIIVDSDQKEIVLHEDELQAITEQI